MNRFDIKDMISSLEHLSFKEAKSLYWENQFEENEHKYLENMNRILLGTLYIPNNLINKDELDPIISRKYDSDDIISICNLLWIEMINKNELINNYSYNGMLNQKYFNSILKSLNVDKTNKYSNDLNISYPFFTGLYNRYIINKKLNKDLTREEIKETMTFKADNNLFDHIDNNLIPFFDQIHELNMNMKSNLDYLKTYYYYILSKYYPSRELKYDNNISDDNEFIDKLEDNILYKEFSEDVLKYSRSNLKKQIITLHFGLLDNDPLLQEEISKITNISRSFISNIEQSTLNSLSKNKKILEYKSE